MSRKLLTAEESCLTCLGMNFLRFSFVALTASFLSIPAVQAQPTTATTEPVGFVTVGITAGTGTAKRNTLFSVPLMETE